MTCDELLTSLRYFRPQDFTVERGYTFKVSVFPPDPSPVGMAVPPKVALLLRAAGIPFAQPDGLPTLIDGRLGERDSELFFDATQWQARCAEQAQWEAQRRTA